MNNLESDKINLLKIAPCLLPIMVDIFGFGLVYPIAAAMFSDTNIFVFPNISSSGLRYFYLSLTYMLYPFFMLFGSPFLGNLSDILGRKKVITLCMSGMCLSYLLMGIGIKISNVFLFLFGRALSGLMSGSQQIAQAAISDISTENNRIKNMGFVTLTISIGLIISPIIGGMTSDKSINHFFNFATPFFISALLSFIASGWLYFGFHETFQLTERKKFNFTQYIKDFAYINSHKPLRLLTIIFLLFQIGFGLFFSLIFSLLHHEFNYTSWQLGAFNAFLGLNFVVGMLLLGNILMKRLSPKKLAILCILILGVSQILIALIHSERMTWLLIIPLAMFDIVGYTVLLSLFGKVASAEKQGWVMGISGSLSACSYIITGLSPNLLNIFNARIIILAGGILILISIFLIKKFYENYGT